MQVVYILKSTPFYVYLSNARGKHDFQACRNIQCLYRLRCEVKGYYGLQKTV